jgi:hypothetical protein
MPFLSLTMKHAPLSSTVQGGGKRRCGGHGGSHFQSADSKHEIWWCGVKAQPSCHYGQDFRRSARAIVAMLARSIELSGTLATSL